jgi:hypothetical protein
MKLIVLFILLSSCNNLHVINDNIYDAQKQTLSNSPYKSASGAFRFLDPQKEFRIGRLPKLMQDRIFKMPTPIDTVWISETFDEVCSNCPSDWMKILFRDTVYTLERHIDDKNRITYIVKSESFKQLAKIRNTEIEYDDLLEVVQKVRSKLNWSDYPLQYGSDDCADGDHTLFTIIYPDKKIEAMYVRCWQAFTYRNRK